MLDPAIVAAIIGAAVLVALALAGVIWQMGRLVGRVDSLKELMDERQKGVVQYRREHNDRHNVEAKWWEKVHAHYDSHAHAVGGD